VVGFGFLPAPAARALPDPAGQAKSSDADVFVLQAFMV